MGEVIHPQNVFDIPVKALVLTHHCTNSYIGPNLVKETKNLKKKKVFLFKGRCNDRYMETQCLWFFRQLENLRAINQ